MGDFLHRFLHLKHQEHLPDQKCERCLHTLLKVAANKQNMPITANKPMMSRHMEDEVHLPLITSINGNIELLCELLNQSTLKAYLLQ